MLKNPFSFFLFLLCGWRYVLPLQYETKDDLGLDGHNSIAERCLAVHAVAQCRTDGKDAQGAV